MVNSILNNPVILDQLVKAYMANAASSDATKNEGAEKSYLKNNAEADEFVNSNATAESTISKDEVMDILLDMSDAELTQLAEDLGVEISVNAEEETTEAPQAPQVEAPKAETPATTENADGKGAADVAATTEVKDAKEVSDAEAATAASSTSSTILADDEESSKIQEEIDELETSKEKNYKKMEKLEAEIEDLTAKAENNILKAAAAQEKKVEEHEEETQKAVEENIQAYVEANKEGGKGMTRSELQGNIKGALSNVPEIGNAVSAAIAANDQLNMVDSKLGDLNTLIADTKSIENEIESKQKQYDAVKASEEAEAKAKEEAKSCDPIGFTMGEGAEQVKYDFIVDDGAFDSTSDFLGAENQWAEMQALDVDGDQIVTAAELEAANIKAVKTDANGNQEIVSITEELGEDFSIDLASYTEGGSHSAVQTGTDHDGDKVADQQLLGTFSMNVNGQSVQGYNTLDDTEWLQENYGLSAASTTEPTAEATAEENATTLDANSYSTELKSHVNFFNTYSQKVEDLKAQLKDTWISLGQTEATLRALNGEAVEEAAEDTKEIDETIDTEATEETTAEEETTEEVAENGNAAASEEATEIDPITLEEIKEEEEEENFFAALAA